MGFPELDKSVSYSSMYGWSQSNVNPPKRDPKFQSSQQILSSFQVFENPFKVMHPWSEVYEHCVQLWVTYSMLNEKLLKYDNSSIRRYGKKQQNVALLLGDLSRLRILTFGPLKTLHLTKDQFKSRKLYKLLIGFFFSLILSFLFKLSKFIEISHGTWFQTGL